MYVGTRISTDYTAESHISYFLHNCSKLFYLYSYRAKLNELCTIRSQFTYRNSYSRSVISICFLLTPLRDMEHALTLCREHVVPAIYRGVRDIFGLTVGEPIPNATSDDINPSTPSMDQAPISILDARFVSIVSRLGPDTLYLIVLNRNSSNASSFVSYCIQT